MSGRSAELRALELADAIYAAAVEPERWPEFLQAFSDEMGGPAVAMSLMLPGWNLPPEYYRVRLSPKYVPAFERHFRQGLPWPMTDPLFRQGFARGSEIFPDRDVPGTGYYRDYMQPQGLAPEGPVAHLIVAADGRPVSGISIQRFEGGRVLDDDDLALCNQLVPHLRLANEIRNERIRTEQQRGARTEILDRMPVGIVILDEARRAVVSNRFAREIVSAQDGLYLREGVLHASHPRDETALQGLLRAAIRVDLPEGGASSPFEGDFVAIARPSGRPSYALTVSRLFASPKLSALGDEVAAVFIADPAPGRIPHGDTFRELFGLTAAETEVASLLAAGHSVESISEHRGVGVSTTRTLLRRIFAKTRTNRQGEIVRLVLSLDPVASPPRDDEDDA